MTSGSWPWADPTPGSAGACPDVPGHAFTRASLGGNPAAVVVLKSRLNGDREELTGSCVFFLEGEISWR